MKIVLATRSILLALTVSITIEAQPYLIDNNDVFLEEMIIFFPVAQPAEYFYEAKHNYLQGHHYLAAKKIREGARALLRSSSNATAEGKKALLTSYHSLNKLALDMENQSYVPVNRINRVFAVAHYNLANHQYMKAKNTWAKKAYQETGDALTAAANNLREAASWAGNKIEVGGAATINGAREVGKSLEEGTQWTEDKVGKGIENLGKLLTTTGKKLETKDQE